ncbi:MAG TPA: gamma-glutamyl-gamma-aminobutyrate hydrolase family protein [Solirubrobacteraceae bacterium]|nr:gamma-glutamyl-gamma-aminobutyrate hydrolase family protein [Solirubrobacteraceae bacterium]
MPIIRRTRPHSTASPHRGAVVPLRPAPSGGRRFGAPAAPPLIGIVTHELTAGESPVLAATPGRSARDRAPQRLALRLSYSQAVQDAGGLAVVLPAHGYTDDTAALLDRLDGLLLSGGPDFDPAVYGQARHPELGPDVDAVSDRYELALLAGALERDLPVLAICRGMQALNLVRGGTLHQHLPDRTELEHRQRHDAFVPAHPVSIAPESLLHRLAGSSELAVNSFHHQAADRLGGGLEVAATAPDGTVEALWDPAARFALGVQWHAELLTHRPEHAALFGALVAAACSAAVAPHAVAA